MRSIGDWRLIVSSVNSLSSRISLELYGSGVRAPINSDDESRENRGVPAQPHRREVPFSPEKLQAGHSPESLLNLDSSRCFPHHSGHYCGTPFRLQERRSCTHRAGMTALRRIRPCPGYLRLSLPRP